MLSRISARHPSVPLRQYTGDCYSDLVNKSELQSIRNRKGAVGISEIPPVVRELLDHGIIESVNLTEWLSVDQVSLLRTVLPKLGLRDAVKPALTVITLLKKPSQMQSIVAEALRSHARDSAEVYSCLLIHVSVTVRSWAAYVVGEDETLPLSQKLDRLRPLATDGNSGVRKVAWISLRGEIERDPRRAIKYLIPWTLEPDTNLRRFASESTRPRGVWCKHLERFKVNPEMGLPILESIHSDPSKDVHDSVANWLNDASKSRPVWYANSVSDGASNPRRRKQATSSGGPCEPSIRNRNYLLINGRKGRT